MTKHCYLMLTLCITICSLSAGCALSRPSSSERAELKSHYKYSKRYMNSIVYANEKIPFWPTTHPQFVQSCPCRAISNGWKYGHVKLGASAIWNSHTKKITHYEKLMHLHDKRDGQISVIDSGSKEK